MEFQNFLSPRLNELNQSSRQTLGFFNNFILDIIYVLTEKICESTNAKKITLKQIKSFIDNNFDSNEINDSYYVKHALENLSTLNLRDEPLYKEIKENVESLTNDFDCNFNNHSFINAMTLIVEAILETYFERCENRGQIPNAEDFKSWAKNYGSIAKLVIK